MLYAFAHYELDTQLFVLRCHGILTPIQPKPLDLLVYLVEHRDRVVTKRELLARLWPDVQVTENALQQAVATVREALSPSATGAVVSVRGRGYRFELPVLELGHGESTAMRA